MAMKSSEDRLDRVEQIVQVLAEEQLALEKLVGELATETRRGFDQVAKQFEETDRRMGQMRKDTDEQFRQSRKEMDEEFRRWRKEMDERLRQSHEEMDERFRQTDEQIRQTDERLRVSGEIVDERINKLVIAIGEFILRQPPATAG